jgi:hypothetical protein
VRHWVVQDIGVPVELLRVGGVGHDGVGGDETAGAGQVVTSVHEDETQIIGRAAEIVVLVAGIALVGEPGRRCHAPTAIGEVTAAAVRYDRAHIAVPLPIAHHAVAAETVC